MSVSTSFLRSLESGHAHCDGRRLPPPQVSFEQSASEIDACDFLENGFLVAGATAKTPFQEIAVTGRFQGESGPPLNVEGFCDSMDGRRKAGPARSGG